jgi:molecular chaperone DnaJ
VTNTILGRMQTAAPCNTCGGTGQTIDNRPPNSDSQGFVVEEETVSIKIPAGVVDGMQLKVTGKGNAAPGNGISGDLLVAITEETHPTLQREGDNLHYDLYVSLPDAILGSSIEIETVTGKVRLKIEAGVQSGKILRLRGKGIPNVNGYSRGDLLVHINVWTPKTLSKEQKTFFEKMKSDEHFSPKPESSDKSFFEKVKDMFS